MSGYSATQLEAYRRVDRSAGQSLVWDAIEAHPGCTRQELVALTGKPINAICGRVSELLDAGQIKVTGSRGGRETLSINAAGRMPATVRRGDAVEHPTPATTATAVNAPSAAPYVAVTPTLFHRMSMTLDEARRTTGLEAELVREVGQFRVWGDDLELCVGVQRVLNK